MASNAGTWNRWQRTMLQWNELHPYNAVHVARLSGALDLNRLQSAIHRVVEARGLTGLVMDAAHNSFRYDGGPADGPVEPVPTTVSLSDEIERQLNQRFPQDGAVVPFRFRVFVESGTFQLLLAYFHPVADADSIVRLVKDIAAAYCDPLNAGRLKRWNLAPPHPDLAILRRPGLLLRWLAGLPAAIRDARQASRPAYRNAADGHNGFRCFNLADDALPQLTTLARTWEVTLNDLFLAALMLAIAPEATIRWRSPRRRQLSVGCIVNVRRDTGIDGETHFGLALGSFRVGHEVPEGIRLGELARAIREQTSRVKRTRSFLATSLQLAIGNLVYSRSSPDRRARFYGKHNPLWAGLTNLNVDGLWPAGSEASCTAYLRAVSTGPATPLVLSITTSNQRLTVGLSHRTTVYLNSQVDRVQDAFQQCLEHATSSC